MMMAVAAMVMVVPVVMAAMIMPVIVRTTVVVVMGMVVAVIVFRHADSGENATPIGNPARAHAPGRALPRLRIAANRGA